jgi:hypothetical protein
VASLGLLSVRAGKPSTLKVSAVLRHMTVSSCVVADSKDLAGFAVKTGASR